MPKNLRCTEADFGRCRGIQNGPENELQRVGQLIELLSVFPIAFCKFPQYLFVYCWNPFCPITTCNIGISSIYNAFNSRSYPIFHVFFPTSWSFRITFTTRFTFSCKTMMNVKGRFNSRYWLDFVHIWILHTRTSTRNEELNFRA